MTTLPDLRPFKDLVRLRCGLTFEGPGEEALLAAVHKRIDATGARSPATYFARLTVQDDEFQEFISLLTINETYFFREPEQLALLVDRLVPRLLADNRTRLPLRILSAGCSSGEEPYSIAMAMLEKYGEGAPRLVTILGGDIDQHALDRARTACFGAFSFRSLAPDLRERYFRPVEGKGHALSERVTSLVRFHHLNLLAGGFEATLQDLDIVFFRNVSIYFDEPTRRVILRRLRAAMAERAYLITGSAETLANDLGVFDLVEDQGAFYFAKDTLSAPTISHPPAPAPRPARIPPPATPTGAPAPLPLPPLTLPALTLPPRAPQPPAPRHASAPAAAPSLETLRTLVRDKRFDDALAGLKAAQAADGTDARLVALEGYVRMLRRDFAAAATAGERALALDEWSIDALVLLGLVAKWQDDHATAIAWLKKAVYGRHDCWPAHYYLGDMLRAAGSLEPARRAYRLALQQVNAAPDPDGGLVLPLGLPVPEVRFLCERHAGTPAVTAGGR